MRRWGTDATGEPRRSGKMLARILLCFGNQESHFGRFILGEWQSKEIGEPYGVAVNEERILICDSRGRLIAIFDLKARSFELVDNDPSGRFGKPTSISANEDETR